MMLASVEDLEVIAGPQADPVRAERLLEMSSARVERWCRRSFSYVEDDEVTVTVSDGDLILPNGPVIAVGAITGPGGTAYASSAYEVDRSGRVTHSRLGGPSYEGYGRGRSNWCSGNYEIVYTHGYDVIPDDVIAAVCMVAAGATAGTFGVGSESLGSYSVTMQSGAGSGVALTDEVKGMLKPYRHAPTSVLMARG